MSDTQDDNVFGDGFSWGSWLTSNVFPKLLVVVILSAASGIGAITYGYYKLSWQMDRLQETSCCGEVQQNQESVRELKRAVSILVKLHTDEDQTNGQLNDILNRWGRDTSTTSTAPFQDTRLEGNDSRQPFGRTPRYPDKAILTAYHKWGRDKRIDQSS